MTVEVASAPVHQKSLGHLTEFRSGNHDHDLPQETIDLEIATLRRKLEAKPTFDPNLKFDPAKHLVFKDEYYKTTKQCTLDDLSIGRTRVAPVCDFAAAFPFPLLSQEAVDMMLWEAINPDTIAELARTPNLSTNATRLDFHVNGHTEQQSPFTKALFKSRELTSILEGFTKVKMDPVYECDRGFFNFSLASLKPDEIKAGQMSKEQLMQEYSKQNQKNGEEIPSTLGLHYDSNTFALVIMMDIGDDAVGGETGIITGDNKVYRVPEPKPGYATLIQGMVLRHVATKPITNSNRIACICGYGLASPENLDNCVLTTLKPSVLPRKSFDAFYRDWTSYRLTNLEKHLQYYKEKLLAEFDAGVPFDQPAFIKKCVEMEKYLRQTWCEMEAVNNDKFPPAQFNVPYEELPDYE